MANRWCIYYADGSFLRDCDISPENVPRRGIQVIAVEDNDAGQAFLRNNDYYWWDYEIDSWSSGDIFGLFDYLLEPGVKIVLFGRTISNDEYRAIMIKAVSGDDYLPRKSARHEWERK